jgi:hypothetical protein
METNDQKITNAVRKSNAAALWAVAAFVLAIFSCTHNSSAMVLEAGFFAKLFAVIVGTALGTLGALGGDAIRKFAQPDFLITTGGFFQFLWVKVFWKIGPQVVGLFIGVFMGCGLVLR